MIRANNLTITYAKPLFQDLSFTLGNKEKVGLVGLNGSGKTTLLKIMVGLEKPDEGKFEIQNEKISYLPQEYTFKKEMMVGEFLEDLVDNHVNEMYKVNRILAKLKFEPDIYQEIQTLSEGQKMKLYLTKLMMEEPTILLLDEPTNHLDITGIDWLEAFIKNFEGNCIIISHDREFLNNTIDTVFEIDECKLYSYKGNYDDFLVQKAEDLEKRRDMVVLQEKKRKQLEILLENVSKIGDGKKRGRAMSAARHRMDREVNQKEIFSYEEQRIKDLKLKGFVHNNKFVLKIRDLNFSYAEKQIFENVNFDMFGKERVWFYGANGIGKTTLVKLILGQLKADTSELRIGNGLKYTYFSQDQSHLDMEDTVENYFISNTGISFDSSFALLEKFLFSKDIRKTKIGKLSPGQRARLSFAVFSMKEFDFMILDEPTNHLDIRSKEVIENALRDFQGAILLISHDRYFVNSVGYNRKITIKDKKLITGE
ncbi:MAG: ABC-F family ATP-binding cassette domain-containing protein [Candidatus Dojkabacteria bacterium]